ncbi:tyrosine-protein phosphatase [Mesobacillus selenatarsenatis]|uniref:Tyrosine-protein phosphatase n=1 Tax=Mesobacillus selenatarsenatis (strain DSM 18680 / JCM 14380 / FERM P-15431 / SF-1) TaxID=1321606 RepID=A0A0A8XDI2_MESS1|nr:CpsB/CapC family capsule biosynthesis tyrosine phosphatase [Mesobacillus selenatarsenatis]GAM16226.1 manganese-dependent protein-tyrosine phosphatase [Mesobacillus selenatarsenatis SF-1]
MIDIHCHILPGIDDGAQSMEDTIKMARAAVDEGIHTIIATPHHKNSKYDNPKEFILPIVEEVNTVLNNEGVDLKVLPGQEVRLYGDVIEGIEKNELLSLNNTQYLFIEFPSNHVPRYAERLLFDLQLKEVTPIIVHPERNQEIIERPEVLYNLVKKGALTQVTASSVSGHFGKKIRNFSYQLIEANLTHFIASDAHNVGNRGFKMAETMELIESKYGIDLVYYFQENAELLVQGNHVYQETPEPVKKKKFLGIF